MIMQDKNNLQIADLILQWIDERVSKRVAKRNDTPRGTATLNPDSTLASHSMNISTRPFLSVLVLAVCSPRA